MLFAFVYFAEDANDEELNVREQKVIARINREYPPMTSLAKRNLRVGLECKSLTQSLPKCSLLWSVSNINILS